MKKSLLHLLLLLLAIPQFAIAQDGWIKKILGPGAEHGYYLTKISDGNYIFSMEATEGLGSNIDPGHHLIKIDANGNFLWTKKIETQSNYSIEILETNDDGLLLRTERDFDGNGLKQPFLIKTDANGEEEWSDFFFFGDSTSTNVISDIKVALDGGYLIIGNIPVFGEALEVKKMDVDFNEVWTYSSNYYPSFLTENDQGEIGVTTVDETVLKLDSNGNELWETQISANDGIGMEIHSHEDGGFTVFTVFGAGPEFAKKQVRIDSNGNILFEKDIPLTGHSWAPTNTVQVSDGFILSNTIKNHLPDGGYAIYMIKTDFNGNTVWENKINAVANIYFELTKRIAVTHEEGIIGLARYHDYTIDPFNALYVFKTDAFGQVYANKLVGKIGREEQINCIIDSTELALNGWFVSAQNTTDLFYASTDSLGNYCLPLDTGQYTLAVHPPNSLWTPCENNIPISLTSNSTISNDFPMEAIIDCPLLAVSSFFPIARPCFDNNTYYINYCNEGTSIAEDAYLEIEVDSELSYVSSTINLSSQNGNLYTFDLGNISAGECDNFQVDFLLDCETSLGQSICVTSHIYPDSFCLPTDPNWNGAFVEVDITCKDSVVNFYLENTGTGNMASQRDYIVVEDAILLITDDYQLPVGGIDSFSLPADGATYTLIAEQVQNAPGDLYPAAWLEGCGNNEIGEFSMGYINQFSLGDGLPFVDTDCTTARASYDPNDKQGFPLGYSDEHYIRPNTDLDYMIRFQNTGTDTAFTVVIRDTISTFLDMTSIEVGTSSHPYEWKISGENILEFTFNAIQLPDSIVNEPASHGFVKFRIAQQADLPLGTVIKNEAAIYFDFNAPIITNETYHTLGVEFIMVSTQRPISEATRIVVRPNPLQDYAIFETYEALSNGLFELYDILGKRVWQQKISGKQFELKRNTLNSGTYFYRISDDQKVVNSGKIIIN